MSALDQELTLERDLARTALHPKADIPGLMIEVCQLRVPVKNFTTMSSSKPLYERFALDPSTRARTIANRLDWCVQSGHEASPDMGLEVSQNLIRQPKRIQRVCMLDARFPVHQRPDEQCVEIG